MTNSTLQLLPAEPILAQIENLAKKLDSALDRSGENAIYATAGTISTRYGMSRRCTHLYLAGGVSDGKIRIIRPTQPNGKPGNTLYHIADFEAYIRRPAIC